MKNHGFSRIFIDLCQLLHVFHLKNVLKIKKIIVVLGNAVKPSDSGVVTSLLAHPVGSQSTRQSKFDPEI